MEEDQEVKYSCKLCNKSFPCGRSLGGHMKSHVINSNAVTDLGYGLRENPKKTCRFEDTLFTDMFCKECGKGFQSWNALFGHMKCHSNRPSNNFEEEEEDNNSWTDSQSENGIVVSHRKRRSSRKIKRYMPMPPTTSSSVSEVEQEKQEVAKCLMMLSRDVSHWGESSHDSDSQANIVGKNNNSISSLDEAVKYKKLRSGKLESTSLDKSGGRKSEFSAYEVKKSEIQALVNEKNSKKSKLGKNWEFDEAELGFKRKGDDFYDPEWDYDAFDAKNKRSQFECDICKRAFHSYQALGGHRASHKKIKGCSASKINSSQSSFETYNINSPIDQEMGSKKKKGSHECPICFRVFSSGQALGGHKRSHTIVTQKPIEENREFLDLNMPAPVEEEGSNSQGGFKPGWVESNHN